MANYYFNDTLSGSFSLAGGWTVDGIPAISAPDSDDIVHFAVGAQSYTVNLSSGRTVEQIVVDNDDQVTLTGGAMTVEGTEYEPGVFRALDIVSGSLKFHYSSTALMTTADIRVGGENAAELIFGGGSMSDVEDITLRGGSDLTVTEYAYLYGGDITLRHEGSEFLVDNYSRVYLTGDINITSGDTLNVYDNGYLYVGDDIEFEDDYVTLSVYGGSTLTVYGGIGGEGADDAYVSVVNSSNLNAGQEIFLDDDVILTIGYSSTVRAYGGIVLDTDATVNISYGGSLYGDLKVDTGAITLNTSSAIYGNVTLMGGTFDGMFGGSIYGNATFSEVDASLQYGGIYGRTTVAGGSTLEIDQTADLTGTVFMLDSAIVFSDAEQNSQWTLSQILTAEGENTISAGENTIRLTSDIYGNGSLTLEDGQIEMAGTDVFYEGDLIIHDANVYVANHGATGEGEIHFTHDGTGSLTLDSYTLDTILGASTFVPLMHGLNSETTITFANVSARTPIAASMADSGNTLTINNDGDLIRFNIHDWEAGYVLTAGDDGNGLVQVSLTESDLEWNSASGGEFGVGANWLDDDTLPGTAPDYNTTAVFGVGEAGYVVYGGGDAGILIVDSNDAVTLQGDYDLRGLGVEDFVAGVAVLNGHMEIDDHVTIHGGGFLVDGDSSLILNSESFGYGTALRVDDGRAVVYGTLYAETIEVAGEDATIVLEDGAIVVGDVEIAYGGTLYLGDVATLGGGISGEGSVSTGDGADLLRDHDHTGGTFIGEGTTHLDAVYGAGHGELYFYNKSGSTLEITENGLQNGVLVNEINDFSQGDAIELLDMDATAMSLSADEVNGVLYVYGGGDMVTLDFEDTIAAADFRVTAVDGHVRVSLVPPPSGGGASPIPAPTLSGANDTFTGDAEDNTVSGLAGDDVIHAGNGNDAVYGNQGEDTLTGDAGDDDLYGGQSDDQLDGGSGDDGLWGNRGDDHADGAVGNDLIYGNEDNDQLLGGADDDVLYGGQGDDTLSGGAGDDTLSGNLGADVYVFGANEGSDTILNFSLDQGDKLDIGDQTYTAVLADDGTTLTLSGGGQILLLGVALPDDAAAFFV